MGRQPLVNARGWEQFRAFWTAATDPDLSGRFLGLTWRATLTTGAFALLATALSVVIGLVGGVLTSETWWQRSRPNRARRRGSGRPPPPRPGWYIGRVASVLPRGVHEAVWGLLLVNVLGRDPLVGILAIAIPFGAITAKVYAELIDEAADGAFEAHRLAGAGRISALAYGVLPQVLPDLVSYGFYRLECSIRSAVILGMIGAGGIGFQLNLSFASLNYSEMWTLIYALILASALADRWGAWLRRGSSAVRIRLAAAVGLVGVVASLWELRPDLGRLFSARTRELFADVATDAWPPSLPSDGWAGLASRTVDTLQMSVLAIALGAGLAVAVAFVAARRHDSAPAGRVVGSVARLLLLVTRAIPPPVWALLILFVLFPGPLPGAVALGLYNFGILGRLMAEVVENLDHQPEAALHDLGASGFGVFTYATLPLSAARFAAYALYRWEVALRETVVVGVVGAGGLGRLLEQQRAAFDYSGMLGTVMALILASLAVDLISASARRSLR